MNRKSVLRSYGQVTVTGKIQVGGLVGSNEMGGSVTESYWHSQATGQTSSEGVTSLTTAQIQGVAAESNMTGFNFTDVWQSQAGDYPILRDMGGQ